MGFLTSLSSAVAAMLGALAGAIAAVAIAVIYVWIAVIPGARSDGAASERADWQHRQAEAETKAKVAQDTAQRSIDAIERAYHAKDARRAGQMAKLEKSLQDERETNANTPSGGSCRPAIPRGVSKSIDALGRPAPGAAPAIPDTSLP